MNNHNHRWGELGENITSTYLEKTGYKILARNWHCHQQEIDLIAKDQSILVLIEVKLRLSNNFDLTNEPLNNQRLKQLKLAATYFSKQYPTKQWRYDFIIIDFNFARRLARLSHYRQII